MTTNANPNLTIPEGIIYEILSRLPVKSLLKFRSVSKLWLSMISSPQFIKSHLSRSTENTHFTNHKLILSFTCPDSSLKVCSIYSLLNEPISEAVELDYPMKNPDNLVYVVGSCNGLVCLIIENKYLFLWNPSTRKSRLVYSFMNMQYEGYPTYGFGYDECSDDYKLVKIEFYRGDVSAFQAKVYSSKCDCWRRIEDFPFSDVSADWGKFINGALHWEANRDRYNDSLDSWIIVSLDMEKETFGEVLQPKYGEGNYDPTLGILSGYLSVVCNYKKTRADIWIMKEYGVKESWTKVVTIPYIYGVDELPCYGCLTPLHIYANGDILVEYEGRIQLYNSKDQIFRNLEHSNITDWLEADIYVESLVSPNAHSA